MSLAGSVRWAATIICLLALGCSDSSNRSATDTEDTEQTLKNRASFPIGNVIYLEDDPRFTDYQSGYSDVLNIVEMEFDYVGHDEIFRIRETHPTPFSRNYTRLDAFVEYANNNGYRVHGHNLLFYSDVGPDSWIAEYRESGTWTRDQWLEWFERYIKEKVGRYKGKVASWDVLNEPLARVIADDPIARNIFIDLAGEDIYGKVFRWAREADPNAKLVLNEFFLGPGGTDKTDELITLAKQIGRDGGIVDIIGFEGIYIFCPLIFTSYSYNYDRFKKAADAGYMVTLSELNVALNIYPAAGRHQDQTRLLHSVQRKAFNNIVRAYMDAVPEKQRWGVVTWGVPDYNGFTRFGDIFKAFRAPGGGSEWPLLWNDFLQKKPAYYGFINALEGIGEPFIYNNVYDEGDLVDDQPLIQDFKAALLDQLEEERHALDIVPSSGSAAENYYNEVRQEIENSQD
jgi:endo-1,4-beta-xylanase